MTDWDVAARYFEFVTHLLTRGTVSETMSGHLRRVAAESIVRKARRILGSVVHPVQYSVQPFSTLPANAIRAELDIEETIENASISALVAESGRNYCLPIDESDLWMQFETHRSQSIMLVLDTSLSMMGEKLALMSIAVCVVLLQFPDDPVGVISFDNEAHVIKYPDHKMRVLPIVEQLLEAPGHPNTNIEAGVLKAQHISRSIPGSCRDRSISTVLLTDGRYTAGKDPAYLSLRFAHLIVLKIGDDQSGYDLCHDMALKGSGCVQEVKCFEELPFVMYRVVQDLLRSRSVM